MNLIILNPSRIQVKSASNRDYVNFILRKSVEQI